MRECGHKGRTQVKVSLTSLFLLREPGSTSLGMQLKFWFKPLLTSSCSVCCLRGCWASVSLLIKVIVIEDWPVFVSPWGRKGCVFALLGWWVGGGTQTWDPPGTRRQCVWCLLTYPACLDTETSLLTNQCIPVLVVKMGHDRAPERCFRDFRQQ